MKRTLFSFYACIAVLLVLAACNPTREDEDSELSVIPGWRPSQKELELLNDTPKCVFTTVQNRITVTVDPNTTGLPSMRGYYSLTQDAYALSIVNMYDFASVYEDQLQLSFYNNSQNSETDRIKAGVYMTGNNNYGRGGVSIDGTYMANGFWSERRLVVVADQKVYVKRISEEEAIITLCDFKARWGYKKDPWTDEILYTTITLNGYMKVNTY